MYRELLLGGQHRRLTAPSDPQALLSQSARAPAPAFTRCFAQSAPFQCDTPLIRTSVDVTEAQFSRS